VVVPTGTIDGPIRVSTFDDVVGEGAVLNDLPFLVPPPDFVCTSADVTRSVTLRLARSLVARGRVTTLVDGGFTACVASVMVKIQRRVAGEWKTVRKTRTSPTGSFKKRIPDRPGRYRANAPPLLVDVTQVLCFRAISPVRTRS
jgi:hypothetical protein